MPELSIGRSVYYVMPESGSLGLFISQKQVRGVKFYRANFAASQEDNLTYYVIPIGSPSLRVMRRCAIYRAPTHALMSPTAAAGRAHQSITRKDGDPDTLTNGLPKSAYCVIS